MHRQLKQHPRFNDSEWLHVWLWLLLSATHGPIKRVFGSETITLKPGQLITSRRTISQETGICESKVERVLNVLRAEQQIEQRSNTVSRLITVTNWSAFQTSEQPSEPRVNSERTAFDTANEQRTTEANSGSSSNLPRDEITNRTANEQRPPPKVNTNKKTRSTDDRGCTAGEVELPPHFPKTEADAITSASFVGVPAEFASKVYDKAVSRGGRDSRDVPIRNFSGYLRIEWKYETERLAKDKRNGNHTSNTADLLDVPTIRV